ncbi:MAG: hypothetical protein LH469_01885 [Frankiaceae bacterium]|nr:hypothetical protein [Frankiaceae bacterium]
MRSRFVALVVSTAAVIGGVVAVFAGTDPVTCGLHAIQRSALALLRGDVVTDVGGNIARVSKAVAACHHAYPRLTPCSDP